MLFILYPYFWSDPASWAARRSMRHPDALHRSFLKAGAARVVLTIRPGFERAFVSFLETGSTTGLPDRHPYVRIAEELQAYANTNYPGIPPANPVEARPLLFVRQRRAWAEMQQLMAALENFRAAKNRYPTTSEGLASLAGYEPQGFEIPKQDPYGHAYHYRCPGQHGDYDLMSLGEDGRAGGEGEAADVAAWAEASLIGRWHEYTPTSALDIAFGETLPSA